jgi:hypothetical protein
MSGHGTTSVADGNTTNVHGNQTITDIHGTGNTTAVDNSVHDSSVHSSSDAAPAASEWWRLGGV